MVVHARHSAICSYTSAILFGRHHASFEVGLIFLFGYLSYALADAASCSGILALFVSGVLESHYHVYSLSEGGRGKAAAVQTHHVPATHTARRLRPRAFESHP